MKRSSVYCGSLSRPLQRVGTCFIIAIIVGALTGYMLLCARSYAATATPATKANASETATLPEQIAHALRQNLASVNTLEAHFKQTTTDARGRHLQTTRGIMQIKRPALFRWQITEPFSLLMVSNGKKVWSYDQELQQVTIRPMDQRSTTIPAAILSGNTKNLTHDYSLKMSGLPDKCTFTLTPKKKSSLFETLQLTFNRHHLSSMKLSDSLGTTTTINFSSIIENKPIANRQFSFTPPKSADVLDETQG